MVSWARVSMRKWPQRRHCGKEGSVGSENERVDSGVSAAYVVATVGCGSDRGAGCVATDWWRRSLGLGHGRRSRLGERRWRRGPLGGSGAGLTTRSARVRGSGEDVAAGRIKEVVGGRTMMAMDAVIVDCEGRALRRTEAVHEGGAPRSLVGEGSFAPGRKGGTTRGVRWSATDRRSG